MGKTKIFSIFFLLVFSCAVCLSPAAWGQEETKILGTVTSIDLNTGTVVVTTYEGQDVAVSVEDRITLDKLKSRRIKPGDDVKVKYVPRGGRNVATYFMKPAGC